MAHETNKPTSPRGREDGTGRSAPKQEPQERPKRKDQEMELPENNRKLGKRHD